MTDSVADRLAKRQGKKPQAAAKQPAKEAPPKPAAVKKPPGRKVTSLSIDAEAWEKLLDGAHREKTTGSAIVETLIEHLSEMPMAERVRVFERARELTAENRRRS